MFSINDAGDKVWFSQGNLQYQASSNTWRFAENQWDYVGTQNPYEGNPGGTVGGSDNSNISSTYSGWIDLFGFGTSGYNHGAVCYQPWSTSQTEYHYDAYGFQIYNLYDFTGQADWGYNAISNGDNQEHSGWRTLTRDEWLYVFNTRNTASQIRYATAQVNCINGVILLPDDWNSSYYSLNNTNNNIVNFSSNVISASQWITLEQYGAVFFPVTGSRMGTSVSGVETYGDYWSSSVSGSVGSYSPHTMFFRESYYVIPNNGNVLRSAGRAVRLVRDY